MIVCCSGGGKEERSVCDTLRGIRWCSWTYSSSKAKGKICSKVFKVVQWRHKINSCTCKTPASWIWKGETCWYCSLCTFLPCDCMQCNTWYCENLSVHMSIRLSVCLSNACIVTKWKKLILTFLYHLEDRPYVHSDKKNGWWGRPLLPEILGQTDPVGAKNQFFNQYSLLAPDL